MTQMSQGYLWIFQLNASFCIFIIPMELMLMDIMVESLILAFFIKEISLELDTNASIFVKFQL